MRALLDFAARELLGGAHAHDHADEPAGAAAAGAAALQGSASSPAAASSHMAAVSTLPLRITAIFVIWVGAVLFGLPTLVLEQFRSQDAPWPRLIRAFSGGTIVALALVHIVPEAVHQLEDLVEFHLAGCTILFGILVLVLIDSSLAAFLTPEAYKAKVRAGLQDSAGHSCTSHHHSTKDSATAGAAATASASAHKQHQHGDHAGAQDQHSASASAHHPQHPAGDSAKDLQAVDEAIKVATPSHSHQCMRGLNATGWVSAAAAPMRNVRQYVAAYTMELGCIFHSVIIGIGVGVITDDRQLVITLMVALAIHQGLEALALGSVLALTNFHTVKKVLMLFLYTITTPIGIAIGISIAASYDATSTTSRAVQGVFNGVSSGMLIYIGMYQLIAEEFSREDLLVRPKLRYGMYAALLLGAAAMCIIGIWS